MQAVLLLDALPGRHAVLLEAPAATHGTPGRPAPDELAGLSTLLRHPRLSGLGLRQFCAAIPDDDEPRRRDDDPWFIAALSATVDALGARGQLEGCSIEHLWVDCGWSCSFDQDVYRAFADTVQVEETFFGTAAVVEQQPVCSLRNFTLQGYRAHKQHIRGILAASRGCLRHLAIKNSSALVGRDPALLCAVLSHIGPSLETLSLDGSNYYDFDQTTLPAVAQLFSAPDCRLRTLRLGGALLEGDSAGGDSDADAAEAGLMRAGGTPLHRFLSSLSRNLSLRRIDLAGFFWNPRGAALFGAALAARAAPLDAVKLTADYMHPGMGVCGPAGARPARLSDSMGSALPLFPTACSSFLFLPAARSLGRDGRPSGQSAPGRNLCRKLGLRSRGACGGSCRERAVAPLAGYGFRFGVAAFGGRGVGRHFAGGRAELASPGVQLLWVCQSAVCGVASQLVGCPCARRWFVCLSYSHAAAAV